jgi:hypothetical protein
MLGLILRDGDGDAGAVEEKSRLRVENCIKVFFLALVLLLLLLEAVVVVVVAVVVVVVVVFGDGVVAGCDRVAAAGCAGASEANGVMAALSMPAVNFVSSPLADECLLTLSFGCCCWASRSGPFCAAAVVRVRVASESVVAAGFFFFSYRPPPLSANGDGWYCCGTYWN